MAVLSSYHYDTIHFSVLKILNEKQLCNQCIRYKFSFVRHGCEPKYIAEYVCMSFPWILNACCLLLFDIWFFVFS